MFLKKFPKLIFAIMSLLIVLLAQSPVQGARITKIHSGPQLLDFAGQYENGDVFILAEDVTLTEPLIFSGTGKLKLDLDGNRLTVTADQGDAVSLEGAGQSLTLTDSAGGGVLSAASLYQGSEPGFRGSAGINVFGSDQSLIIHNVTVKASGGNFGAGIQNSGEKTEVIIESGDVWAQGGLYGAGLGGGYQDFPGKIFIRGGSVEAVGGSFGAGIGTGGFHELLSSDYRAPGLISISGGRVVATGGQHGAGIGGGQLQGATEISVSGGNVFSTGGVSGAGIGTGKFNIVGISYDDSVTVPGKVSVTSGNIKALGGDFAAGIGTGEGASDLSSEKLLEGRKISITGGNVVSIGGAGGAGVGGGACLSGGEIELGAEGGGDSEVTLDATGGRQAAGIGGGKGGVAGKSISVASGNIHAFAGDEAAGIGSGSFSMERLEPTEPYYQQRKNISITGGSVTATAHEMAAAIGGGTGGSGANVKISGSPKINASNTWEISIGAGKFSYDNGTLTVDGGNIRASNSLGIQPKNSAGEPVYRGTFTVCSEDEKKPIENAGIDILLNDSQLFSVQTSVDGKAVVYLPENISPLDLRVGDGRFGFGDGSDLKFSRDDETNKTFAISEEGPFKILTREATYYVNSKTDSVPLEYEGGIKELLSFKLINNQSNMEIDPFTGELKVPINIKPGLHSFTINAYENQELADSADFALTVKNPLMELIPSERETEISTGEARYFSFSTNPADADIVETNWRVTSDNSINCEITDMFGETKEKRAVFTASAPGLYRISVAAKDSDSNIVSETVTVYVAEESEIPLNHREPEAAKIVPLILGGEQEPEAVTVSAQGAEPLPAIGGWSAERVDAGVAKVYFESSVEGLYKYELISEGQESNGIFLEGSPISEGSNGVTIAGLGDQGAYDYRIKLLDGDGRESNVRSIKIPAYVPEDILPPSIEAVEIKRVSGNEASLAFNSDEDGKLYYAISDKPGEERGLTWFDFQETSPIVEGKNNVNIFNMGKSTVRTLYVILEDERRNQSETLQYEIPAYEEHPLVPFRAAEDLSEGEDMTEEGVTASADEGKEIKSEAAEVLPVLTAGTARRTGATTATISIHALSYGEYYCALVPTDYPAPQLDITKGAYSLSPGTNIVNLSELSPGLSYDAYLLYKDEAGRTSNSVRVAIPGLVVE